jgi:hypothetical protein
MSKIPCHKFMVPIPGGTSTVMRKPEQLRDILALAVKDAAELLYEAEATQLGRFLLCAGSGEFVVRARIETNETSSPLELYLAVESYIKIKA